MRQLIEKEDELRLKNDKDDQDRELELEKKRQEKMDTEQAARYIQRKWKWF